MEAFCISNCRIRVFRRFLERFLVLDPESDSVGSFCCTAVQLLVRVDWVHELCYLDRRINWTCHCRPPERLGEYACDEEEQRHPRARDETTDHDPVRHHHDNWEFCSGVWVSASMGLEGLSYSTKYPNDILTLPRSSSSSASPALASKWPLSRPFRPHTRLIRTNPWRGPSLLPSPSIRTSGATAILSSSRRGFCPMDTSRPF